MSEPVEALLFDVDDTICEYRRDHAEVLALAFESVGVEPFFGAAEYYAAFDDHLDEGESIREVRASCFAALADERGRDPTLGRRLADAYASERDASDVRPLPNAVEVVETLAAEYPVAAVTNGPRETQWSKLERLGVDHHFETAVYAGYEVAAKPDPEPFRTALEALGTPPERAVKIGNSLAHDVAGAHNAGVRSVWLDRDGVAEPDPKPHYRIEALDELLEEPWA